MRLFPSSLPTCALTIIALLVPLGAAHAASPTPPAAGLSVAASSPAFKEQAKPRRHAAPAKLRPRLSEIKADKPGLYRLGCTQSHLDAPQLAEVKVCWDNKTVKPTRRVIMTGGSHVQQWWTPMRRIADAQKWELIVIEKSGCQLVVPPTPVTTSCQQWNLDALERIRQLKPDAVFTLGSSTRTRMEEQPEAMIAAWSYLGQDNIPVVAIRDTVRFSESVPDCLKRTRYDSITCGRKRNQALSATFPIAANIPQNVRFVDLTDRFCDPVNCRAIIGNTIVYRDASHITDLFAKSLTSALDRQLRRAAPHLY
jgi:hypothetical protein